MYLVSVFEEHYKENKEEKKHSKLFHLSKVCLYCLCMI